jgi:hypothetical protein|tara:strand:- start:50 stop:547 length:498 start_codon:yes stop_codon:yes gene_type:complete
MDKFERTKIYPLPIKERIQHNINVGKKLGQKLTWEQSKKLLTEIDKQEIWVNDIYQVNVLRGKNCDHFVHSKALKGKCDYLTIKTHSKEAIHDWRHFQIIKNELCGDEREAVEIYPGESRLMDTANQYHLWVLPLGESMCFGFAKRKVDYTYRKGGWQKAGQRGL